jgi:hypothetical protein
MGVFMQKFHQVVDDLRRDQLYGVRATTGGIIVLREAENHGLIYCYVMKDGECRAMEAGNEVCIGPMSLVISAEIQGGMRLTTEECQAELDSHTPTWMIDEERRVA